MILIMKIVDNATIIAIFVSGINSKIIKLQILHVLHAKLIEYHILRIILYNHNAFVNLEFSLKIIKETQHMNAIVIIFYY